MFTEILLNIEPLEKRMAVMEDHLLVELIVEKEKKLNFVGNIYKGIVKDVLPGLGAAFIDIGLERTAFLHYTDLVNKSFIDDLDDFEDTNKFQTNESHRITEFLQTGQEIIVQVQKGPVGSKGARLIGEISIPGKLLVFFPHQEKIAISRKIHSYQEKNRIKQVLQGVKATNTGIIVRTEAEGCTNEELIDEYKMLLQTWKFLENKINITVAPSVIFDENDIVSTVVRDIFSSKVDRLVVDNLDFYNEITTRLREYNEELSARCEYYKEDSPIFDAYNIEKEIDKIFQRRVYLPSGGNIIIEPTEAFVSIDINTGSYIGKNSYEDTIKKTNIEAAKEIARQVRLRNLSGILIIDFIDMQIEQNKQDVLNVLIKSFRNDRAKNKIYSYSSLGLVEVSRKRTQSTLMQSYYDKCLYCGGRGKVLAPDSVIFRINRWLKRANFFLSKRPLEIYVHPTLKQRIKQRPQILTKTDNKIVFMEDDQLEQDTYRIILADEKKDVTSEFST